MKKLSLLTVVQNCKKNFLLLVSTVASLCLFLSPTFASLTLTAVIFAAIIVATAFDVAKPTSVPIQIAKIISIILTVLIEYMGFSTFRTTWGPSSKVAALAETMGLTIPALLAVVGAVGCIVGAYAMYALSCWIVTWGAQLFKERLPVREKSEIVANLKRNWYFPISAMAFFCLEFRFTIDYFVGLVIALLIMVTISSRIESFSLCIKNNPLYINVVSAAAAIGICWIGQTHSYATWEPSSKMQALGQLFPIPVNGPMLVAILGAVVAFWFVYICLGLFWTKLLDAFRNIDYRCTISKAEILIYFGMAVVMILGAAAIYLSTDAFYGTEIWCDLIYTSDSPMLLKNDVYLSLRYAENDLRQPLFAIFASPFIGIAYLFCKLFHVSFGVQAIVINCIQIMMLVFTNYILAKMLKLTTLKRICFMILMCCSYTQLLAILMMEQYIVAYFWLILCMYLISENQRPARIALWGAGGTLLTSMVLLPFMSKRDPTREFKAWLIDIMKYGVEFVAIMLTFGRFDIFYSLTTKISSLSNFTGKTLTLADKTKQFLAFTHNCIAAPDAGIDTTTFDHVSWQLRPVTEVNVIGVIILLLIVISAILNRDKKSSLLAAGWAAFSVVMLLGLGWGTKENGLILYALYFGWAFLVLLFQLVEKIEDRLNVKFLVPAFSVGCAIVLAVVNIPAIMEMVNFAITYFPA